MSALGGVTEPKAWMATLPLPPPPRTTQEERKGREEQEEGQTSPSEILCMSIPEVRSSLVYTHSWLTLELLEARCPLHLHTHKGQQRPGLE